MVLVKDGVIESGTIHDTGEEQKGREGQNTILRCRFVCLVRGQFDLYVFYWLLHLLAFMGIVFLFLEIQLLQSLFLWTLLLWFCYAFFFLFIWNILI